MLIYNTHARQSKLIKIGSPTHQPLNIRCILACELQVLVLTLRYTIKHPLRVHACTRHDSRTHSHTLLHKHIGSGCGWLYWKIDIAPYSHTLLRWVHVGTILFCIFINIFMLTPRKTIIIFDHYRHNITTKIMFECRYRKGEWS